MCKDNRKKDNDKENLPFLWILNQTLVFLSFIIVIFAP